MEVKYCTKCRIGLPSTNEYFSRCNKVKSGIRSQCKSCEREYRLKNKEKIRMYDKNNYQKNKELIKDRVKRYRQENEDEIKKKKKVYRLKNIEKIRLKNRLYYLENKDEIISYQEEYREENKDRISNYFSKYREENKDKLSIRRQTRRSRENKLPSTLTIAQWNIILEIFDDRCAYCGSEWQLQQDHFVPVSKGGGYTKENVLPACKSCNSSKNNKDFQVWYSDYKHYSKEREDRILKHFRGMQFNKKRLSAF